VWEGQACLPHYIRKGLYKEGLLRKFKPSNWKEKREVQTFMRERNAVVAFFQARLRAIRAGDLEPVNTFAEAYAVLDGLWDVCQLNRRNPSPERVARFVAFISRQDYIAKHGWHHRDWVGDRENTTWSKRKEARDDSGRMEPDSVLHPEGVRRSDDPRDGDQHEVGDSLAAGSDPLDDWPTSDNPERVEDP
jgi:hypothetical protein